MFEFTFQQLVIPLAKKALSAGLPLSKSITQQLFKYDFVNLLMQIAVIFIIAWITEIIVRAKVWAESGSNTGGQLGLDFQTAIQNLLDNISFGGALFNIVLPQFQNQQSQNIFRNQYIVELFGAGIPIGESGLKIKYWQAVKIIVMALVAFEWYNFDQNNKLSGGKTSPFTHMVFGFITLLLSTFTFPEVVQMIKTLDFNKQGAT